MIANIVKKENTAMDYLGYALYAFGGLGIEILLIMLETNLWGVQNGQWTIYQDIFHWCITCIVWGILSFILFKQVPKIHSKIKITNWFIAGVIAVFSIMYTSLVWNGFKPIIEYTNNGFLKFAVQYVYYVFESLLILLIIINGQKAFEKMVNKKINIPVGGFILAITWGIIHVLTQGIETGIYACIQSLIFGTIYLVLNRNIKFSYVVIALIFML